MSNAEIIAVEAVLRAYEEHINILNEAKPNGTINFNYDFYAVSRSRGKVDGTKEVLRDLLNTKLS